MTHPLVLQLRFTRSEFARALKNVSDADASQRILPMNCIAWNVGHLAWQEQRYFLRFPQRRFLLPEINKTFAFGAPACTPNLSEMLQVWEAIKREVDPWLDELTTEKLQQAAKNTVSWSPTYGGLLQRVIYHYWYHTGENMAIRQILGHQKLPDFVGNIDDEAPYRPE